MFCLVTSVGQREKFCILMRNPTSDLRIPSSNALSLVLHQSPSKSMLHLSYSNTVS